MSYKETLSTVLSWLETAWRVVKEVSQFLSGLIGLVKTQRDEEDGASNNKES